MSASGKRARSTSGGIAASPFGSASRLVACPVCAKRVHLLLAAVHVESHFSDVPGEAATSDAAAAPENEGGAAASAGGGDEDAGTLAGGGGDTHGGHPPGDAEEAAAAYEPGDNGDGDDDEALYGGALAPPPAADGQAGGTYVPGSDAVWVPFKLQACARPLSLAAGHHVRAGRDAAGASASSPRPRR